MQKPTIFFSHSSLDKEYISRLKDMVLKSTSKTVEVFQSSDGESIPFGNNWIHKVEENLNKAKIMLVFVSPKSALSSWIYFEAGFAYAKNVKIIPIGICGVDVGKLKPPLNLLQGFNISGAEGLNNIITVINREFDCDFEECYKKTDFDGFDVLGGNGISTDENALACIDYIQFSFQRKFTTKIKGGEFSIVDHPLKAIEKLLESHDITFRYSQDNKIHSHGVIVTESSNKDELDAVSVIIDPYSLAINEHLLNDLCNVLYGKGKLTKFWCNILFNENVSLETKDFKSSSKLHIGGFEMSSLNGSYYFYDGIDFHLEPTPKRYESKDFDKENLRIVFNAGEFNSKKVFELTSKLIQSKLINVERNL